VRHGAFPTGRHRRRYKPGDCVEHNGVFWKCIRDHQSDPKRSPHGAPSDWVKDTDEE
jgi:hypothetical protein